jgi:hypothetical protein
MAAILTASYVAALQGMDDTQRPLFFNFIANAEKVTVGEVEQAYNSLSAKVAEEQARERKARLLDTLRVDTEAFRLWTTDDKGNEHDLSALDELRARATDLGAVVTFSGLTDGTPRFSVGVLGKPEGAKPAANTASRGGGTGAGRPAADAAQPFVTPDGKRVIGPVTLWLKANVSADILKAKGLMKDDGSLKGSGSVIATAAVKAGVLIESPVPEASPAPVASPEAPAASA